jgi:predicted RNA polymerase sigma factor
MAQGPAAGLDALDAIAALAGDSALAGYHLLHSVRGDLLMKMGNFLRRVRKSSAPLP